jgi:hypothetical protein
MVSITCWLLPANLWENLRQTRSFSAIPAVMGRTAEFIRSTLRRPCHAASSCHLDRCRRIPLSGSLRRSGEIPSMRPLPCGYEVFSLRSACYALPVRDGFHYKFWVYILSSRSGTLYVGITGIFEQRIHQTQVRLN